MFDFRPNFLKFFSLIERWESLTLFSVTNLLSIYDYVFKKWVNSWHFSHFYFFNGFMLFLLHLTEIFQMTYNFWKKNIVKHWLTVVK